MLIFPEPTIICPQCNLILARQDQICPHCSYHLTDSELKGLNDKAIIQFNKSKKVGYVTVILIFVLFSIVYMVGSW